MKTNINLQGIIIVLLTFTFSEVGRAQNLSGSDNFNSSSESSNWATDYTYGSGALSLTDGHLEFASAGTGVNGDYSGRPWNANFGSFTQDWEVQLDTTVLQATTGSTFAAFGLEIWDSADTNLYVGIKDLSNGTSSFDSYLGDGNNNISNIASGNGTAVGAVRITFNAQTKVITTYYDLNGPSDGYNWVQLGSYGLAGSGGSTANTDWAMDSGDNFIAVPFGFTQDTSATPGNVYGDNFLAVPEPSTWTLLVISGAGLAIFAVRRRAVA